MLERNWEKDWEYVCEMKKRVFPYSNADEYIGVMIYPKPLLSICEYWLQQVRKLAEKKTRLCYDKNQLEQRVRELEEENALLRTFIESTGISVNDALVVGKHLLELEKKEAQKFNQYFNETCFPINKDTATREELSLNNDCGNS